MVCLTPFLPNPKSQTSSSSQMEFSGAFPSTSTSALAVLANPEGNASSRYPDKFLEGSGCLGHSCFSGWSLVLDPRPVLNVETFEVVEERGHSGWGRSWQRNGNKGPWGRCISGTMQTGLPDGLGEGGLGVSVLEEVGAPSAPVWGVRSTGHLSG